MPNPISPVRLREQYDAQPQRTLELVQEAVAARQMSLADFSIRELFEGLVPDGPAIVRAMDPTRKSGGTMRLLEAASAMDLSAFSNITGQIFYAETKREFELSTMLANLLCRTRPSPFPYGERVPGVGGIGDQAEVVEEGQPYPTVGVNEEYVDFPRPQVRGFIVPVSRLAIVFDRTQMIVERCDKGVKWLGLNKEKRVLDTVFGVTNTYKRNGTALNTFLTSGAYINDKTGNALVDWTNVEKAELLFDAITDPNTGEPIAWQGDMVMCVPTALRRTAHRIVRATDIRYNDGASNTTAAYGPNPLTQREANMSGGITILSSPYVKARSGSASKWFYGRPTEAFVYNEVWKIETTQAPANSPASFERDIELQFKVSENGVAGVMEPRYWTRQDQ